MYEDYETFDNLSDADYELLDVLESWEHRQLAAAHVPNSDEIAEKAVSTVYKLVTATKPEFRRDVRAEFICNSDTSPMPDRRQQREARALKEIDQLSASIDDVDVAYQAAAISPEMNLFRKYCKQCRSIKHIPGVSCPGKEPTTAYTWRFPVTNFVELAYVMGFGALLPEYLRNPEREQELEFRNIPYCMREECKKERDKTVAYLRRYEAERQADEIRRSEQREQQRLDSIRRAEQQAIRERNRRDEAQRMTDRRAAEERAARARERKAKQEDPVYHGDACVGGGYNTDSSHADTDINIDAMWDIVVEVESVTGSVLKSAAKLLGKIFGKK